MKKFIVLILSLVVVTVCSAQSLTKTTIKMQPNSTYYKYVGVAADTLTSNQDSIIFTILLDEASTTKWNVGCVFTKRSGNDTTVTIRIRGKYFEDEAYSANLAIGTSSNVTSTTGIQKTVSYGTATGYRYMQVSLQLLGMKSTGVKLKSLEFKAVRQ